LIDVDQRINFSVRERFYNAAYEDVMCTVDEPPLIQADKAGLRSHKKRDAGVCLAPFGKRKPLFASRLTTAVSRSS
jgi:hypothetical protein